MANQESLKKMAAEAAIDFIPNNSIIGVGTGSTVRYFIDALSEIRSKIEGAIASSVDTANKLKKLGIEVMDLNQVPDLKLYVDGADEFNAHGYLTKGGGGALTREKIIASAAQQFICIADESKEVDVLGKFPLAIEVIPMARSLVARHCLKLGGDPVYRQGFVTDNGNVILDVYNLNILNPIDLEQTLNNIPGIVCNGVFALQKADVLLVGTSSGLKQIGKLS